MKFLPVLAITCVFVVRRSSHGEFHFVQKAQHTAHGLQVNMFLLLSLASFLSEPDKESIVLGKSTCLKDRDRIGQNKQPILASLD